MWLNLFARLRRTTAPGGRHMRASPSVAVPVDAPALVGAPVLDPPETRVTVRAAEPAELETQPIPAVAAAAVHAGAEPHEPGVTLGFADGASVELPADDPRVATFRAMADAVLEASDA